MALNDRLSKIAAKRTELDRQTDDKRRQERETIAKYRNGIKALAPRIKELYEIALALYQNDIPLGKWKPTPIGGRDEFVSEGIDHALGFVGFERGSTMLGIGIIGGGSCGYHLVVNADGDFIVNPMEYVMGRWTHDCAYRDYCDKCNKFLEGFDDFERRVNEYVDNL